MQLLSNPWNVSSCLKIGEEAHAWLDARKAVVAAKERLERAKKLKDIAADALVSRLADFSETVPVAYEKFRKAIEAALAAAKRSEDEAENSDVGIMGPFEPVDASAVDGFQKVIDSYMSIFNDLGAAEHALDLAAADVGEATRAERAAFAAVRDIVSRLPSRLADAMGAVGEIRAASERSKLEARAFFERVDAMRKQMGEKS